MTSVPSADPGVDARVGGRDPFGDRARARPVVVRGILGVDARLDRRARAAATDGASSASGGRSPRASRTIHSTRSTPVTISVTGCSTWSRVFTSRNAYSPVVGVDDELDGAGRPVADRGGRARPRTAASAARVAAGEVRRRRLLDHLLVAALQRAVALAERDDLAAPVAEDLHLDVAGRDDEPLEEAHVVAEVAAPRAGSRARTRRRARPASSQRRMPMPPPPERLFNITG